MSVIEWFTVGSLAVGCITLLCNTISSQKNIRSLKRLAKTQIELSAKKLELEIRKEQLIISRQQAEEAFFSRNDLSRYQQSVADYKKNQYERHEGPKLDSKMHIDYLEYQSSLLAELKKYGNE